MALKVRQFEGYIEGCKVPTSQNEEMKEEMKDEDIV